MVYHRFESLGKGHLPNIFKFPVPQVLVQLDYLCLPTFLQLSKVLLKVEPMLPKHLLQCVYLSAEKLNAVLDHRILLVVVYQCVLLRLKLLLLILVASRHEVALIVLVVEDR